MIDSELKRINKMRKKHGFPDLDKSEFLMALLVVSLASKLVNHALKNIKVLSNGD